MSNKCVFVCSPSPVAMKHYIKYSDIHCHSTQPGVTSYDGETIRVEPELLRRAGVGDVNVSCRYRNVSHHETTLCGIYKELQKIVQIQTKYICNYLDYVTY